MKLNVLFRITARHEYSKTPEEEDDDQYSQVAHCPCIDDSTEPGNVTMSYACGETGTTFELRELNVAVS